MKTIIDAVNELQGDLNNVSYIKGVETYHCNLNYNADSGWWCSRGVYGDFVCTIDDFTKKASQQAKPELIDGKAYQFENYQRTVMGIYCEEEAVFHTHHGFHYAIGCINIQPLTVGDK